MLRFCNVLAALAIVAGGVVLAAETAAEAPAPVAVTFPHRLEIVALGSSTPPGAGASRQDLAYPAQLEALLHKAMPRGTKMQVLSRDIGSGTADAMAKRLQHDIIARRPDLVVWQTGGDDPSHNVPIERFERETRDGITAMRAAGIEVLLIEPQWSPALDALAPAPLYRDAVRRIGADMNVRIIRRWDLMHDWVRRGLITKAEMVSPDGLHMSHKGYALLARWVASEVLEMKVCTRNRPATTMPAL